MFPPDAVQAIAPPSSRARYKTTRPPHGCRSAGAGRTFGEARAGFCALRCYCFFTCYIRTIVSHEVLISNHLWRAKSDNSGVTNEYSIPRTFRTNDWRDKGDGRLMANHKLSDIHETAKDFFLLASFMAPFPGVLRPPDRNVGTSYAR